MLETWSLFILSQNYVFFIVLAEYNILYLAKTCFFLLVLAEYKEAMEKLIGRIPEKRMLETALSSTEAELIAIYGRRRVGKTFLIKSVCKDRLLFEFSGVHEASLASQLQNFSFALQAASGDALPVAVPPNWITAFYTLQKFLVGKLGSRKSVIFFDEFPWAQTQKSGFLNAFGHFWNNWAAEQDNLVVVICGSAASWMIKNIVKNRGGLHNRLTRRIRLLPFNLQETEAYLKARRINLDQYQVLQLYMAMGGIPQYLKAVEPGESVSQAIDRLYFARNGALREEFSSLYPSLFNNPENHIAIIKALATKLSGLTRTEVIEQASLSSGGTATTLLEELEESGFITAYIPFGKKTKESLYKLSDEYSLFYLKFVENSRARGEGTWLKLAKTPSWKSWSGFAFESICLKHLQQVKNALGIRDVYTEESPWRYKPAKEEQGAQIDLLFDRQDHCINICEIKFASAEFTIDKAYAALLKRKQDVFVERTKTRKTLFLTFITTYGVQKNEHYWSLVQKEVTMDALFH